MKLKEETSSRIVLETDPSSRKWMEYLRMLVIPPLIFAGVIFSVSLPTWLKWVIIVLAILIEMIMIFEIYLDLASVAVTIDISSQCAIRVEKLFFIRNRKTELDLNQVNRVLIHCKEHGHHRRDCRMLLESTNSRPFDIDFYLPTNEKQEAAFILSKKIGSLLRKPVAMKVTDMKNLISEEILQD
jgi:hypothetical protein